MMHEVVNEGFRLVYSKDVLSEVGLAYREVIHSGTSEALEKTSYDALRRGSSIREAKHSSGRLGDPLELGCAECEESSAWRHNGIQRKALSVILSFETEARQQVCDGNFDPTRTTESKPQAP